MTISSPFVVVPVIILVFAASILWSTSSKEDHPEQEDAGHGPH